MTLTSQTIMLPLFIVTVFCSSTGPMELKQDNQLGILYGFLLLSLFLSKSWVPQGESLGRKIQGKKKEDTVGLFK